MAEGDQTPEGPPPTEPPTPEGPTGPIMPGRSDDSTIYIIFGFISGALSFLCCPWLFGPIGIVLGILAQKRGNPLAIWVIALGALGLIIGTVVGILVAPAFYHNMPHMGPGGHY